MSDDMDGRSHINLTADIVSAFVSNNHVQASELAALIGSVHASIEKIAVGEAPAPVLEPQEPAVSVRKSVTNDFIICLEDGKKFKSLKRHLRTAYDLSPEQYREKWNLPRDYPMVAPAYASARSALAKQSGLGQVRGISVPRTAPAKAAPETEGVKKGRGRPRKTEAA